MLISCCLNVKKMDSTGETVRHRGKKEVICCRIVFIHVKGIELSDPLLSH